MSVDRERAVRPANPGGVDRVAGSKDAGSTSPSGCWSALPPSQERRSRKPGIDANLCAVDATSGEGFPSADLDGTRVDPLADSLSESPDPLVDLVRPDLRGFGGYRSARSESLAGEVWLNANESAWANAADEGGACRRYPDPQPRALVDALAGLYGVPADTLVVGRGSDEAIDLLVRALCVPGRDAVLATPPVFGMYAVSARLQGARLVDVPLVEGDAGFAIDAEAIVAAARTQGAKVVFLCSPANPTGQAIGRDTVSAIAAALDGVALVVVDEAYAEFASVEGDGESGGALPLRARHRNLAVLRTLSKAHGLAAARVGCAILDPALARVLRACQAPYPLPAPCIALALAALQPAALAQTRARIDTVRAERERLRARLAKLPDVRRVYASDGNFLLVRFAGAQAAFDALLAAGVVVRDQRGAPALGDALRITIGSPAQNDRVLAALGDADARADVAGLARGAAA